ncbi:MAG: hypothetical protein JSU82_01650 [Rhodospirillales bacterium]|nr:MAG: hypothetical protein JSU82_01650 [Rhodospirillales bacterium]
MTEPQKLPAGIIAIIAFHLASLVLWFFGQTLAVIDYDMVAGWGLQAPRAETEPVVVAVNRAVGLTDTLIMLPLFVPAAIGLLRRRLWGAVCSWLVFGITLYWPVIFWTSEAFYARAGMLHAPLSVTTIVVPGAIWAFAAWGAWYLYRRRALFG